jgi:RNA polymerase I-associated factor PAF67
MHPDDLFHWLGMSLGHSVSHDRNLGLVYVSSARLHSHEPWLLVRQCSLVFSSPYSLLPFKSGTSLFLSFDVKLIHEELQWCSWTNNWFFQGSSYASFLPNLCPSLLVSHHTIPYLLALYIQDPPVDPPQRHLALFLADVRSQAAVPTLRSLLKLYSSLDAQKLANFLDEDEEELVQQMMTLKQASRSISRAGIDGGRLLDGETISTSDLDFAIDGVRL